MQEFGNSPTNDNFPKHQPAFELLKTPRSKDGLAFVRSGLGEEVTPGLFILNKELALIVAALRIVPDLDFLASEARLARAANSGALVTSKDVAQEVSALLERVKAKVDTEKGIFLPGPTSLVRTNLLNLALRELPQFRKVAQHIEGAVNYVTQNCGAFVTEGAQWEKSHLLFGMLVNYARVRPLDGMRLFDTYDKVRETLEGSPEAVAFLQKLGILPSLPQSVGALHFWSALFTGSKCANNPELLSWIRAKMPWPESYEAIHNDGVFIGLFIAQICITHDRPDVALSIAKTLDPVNTICGALASAVEMMSKASLARVARSN